MLKPISKEMMHGLVGEMLKLSYQPKGKEAICPRCHHRTMIQPGPRDSSGKPRVAPVCCYPGCGYAVGQEDYSIRNRKEMSARARQMRYDQALDYFFYYSTVSDKSGFKDTFSNFDHSKKSQKYPYTCARQFATDIINVKPVHGGLIGPKGVGKTHLMYALINEIWHITSYRRNIIFLNMVDLATKQQMSFTDRHLEEWFSRLLQQVKEADVVILDDLGREGTGRWNQKVVNEAASGRAHKALLFTSNLAKDELLNHLDDTHVQDAKSNKSSKNKSNKKDKKNENKAERDSIRYSSAIMDRILPLRDSGHLVVIDSSAQSYRSLIYKHDSDMRKKINEQINKSFEPIGRGCRKMIKGYKNKHQLRAKEKKLVNAGKSVNKAKIIRQNKQYDADIVIPYRHVKSIYKQTIAKNEAKVKHNNQLANNLKDKIDYFEKIETTRVFITNAQITSYDRVYNEYTSYLRKADLYKKINQQLTSDYTNMMNTVKKQVR